MMKDVLEINNLKKHYKDFDYQVDLFIREGETLGLVGPNGAGKTTTINLILNIIKKDSGEIKIFGLDHIKHEEEIKERIGFVFEEQNFYHNMTVSQLLKFCSALYPHWNSDYSKSSLKRLSLPENKKYGQLSKGTKVKLAILIAFSSGGEFFIMDEPTSGLDPKVRNEVLEEIDQIKEREHPAILFSSHLMGDMERIADRIALINNGRIMLMERKTDLKKKWKKIVFFNENARDFGAIPGIFKIRKNNAGCYTIITNNFSQHIVDELRSAGSREIQTSDLNLEEIFLQCVG